MQESSMIDCPKFGGKRSAPACIVFDKYKVCRKNCKSLSKFLLDNPSAEKEAQDEIEKMKKKGSAIMSSRMAGKNLPNRRPKLVCKDCGFVARTIRGLKQHFKQSHEEKKESA
jgi:hypothetical protein